MCCKRQNRKIDQKKAISPVAYHGEQGEKLNNWMATVFRVWFGVCARETCWDRFSCCARFMVIFVRVTDLSWADHHVAMWKWAKCESISKWATTYCGELCPVSRPPPECDLFLIMKWTNWTWHRMPHHSWEVDDWIIGNQTERQKRLNDAL